MGRKQEVWEGSRRCLKKAGVVGTKNDVMAVVIKCKVGGRCWKEVGILEGHLVGLGVGHQPLLLLVGCVLLRHHPRDEDGNWEVGDIKFCMHTWHKDRPLTRCALHIPLCMRCLGWLLG